MRYPPTKAVWGAVLALALLWPATGIASSRHSGKAKLDSALQAHSASSGESQDVIIRTKPGQKASVTAKVSKRTSHYHVHGLINAVSARLSPEQRLC